MALWMQTALSVRRSVCQSTTFVQTEIKTMGWIVMKFGSEIHAPDKMNCNNFGDPFNFYLALSSGHNFNLPNICIVLHVSAN